jgi:hypothetical protein
MTTQLSLYNGALRLLKERHLTSAEVSGNSREAARVLNAVWDDGAVRACLEAAQWKFATRTAMLEASPSVEPDFGLEFGFEKPEDLVRVTGVWADDTMRQPYRTYRYEGGIFFASLEVIFVSYVSEDNAYGNDMSLWPESFKQFVHAWLAAQVAGPLTETGEKMLGLCEKLKADAGALDAMSDPSKDLPIGYWANARTGGRFRRENR